MVDINAVIQQYMNENPGITGEQALAKAVAVGQDANYNFEKTFRWMKSTDVAGTKYSAAIFSNAFNGTNFTADSVKASVTGVSGAFTAGGIASGLKDSKFTVWKSGSHVLFEPKAAVQPEINGLHLES
jgi:hypothetical protein